MPFEYPSPRMPIKRKVRGWPTQRDVRCVGTALQRLRYASHFVMPEKIETPNDLTTVESQGTLRSKIALKSWGHPADVRPV
jgi:hypothetical protein